MWKKAVYISGVAIMLLAGCSNEHEGHDMGSSMNSLAMINVELSTPEQVSVNESATFTAYVTQDSKAVENADKVEFEWWIEGGEHHKLEVKHKESGKYEWSNKFDQAGKYTIISHVTVGAMHSMPSKTFEVK
ncbi:FixH family protein [Paenibacillus marinisediminis]